MWSSHLRKDVHASGKFAEFCPSLLAIVIAVVNCIRMTRYSYWLFSRTLIPKHSVSSTFGGSRPLISLEVMFDASFHCSTGKPAIVSDVPGRIEIVSTLEMYSAMSCKQLVVGRTVITSTCKEQRPERRRKVDIRAISSSPF
jgi:hypothetical protein